VSGDIDLRPITCATADGQTLHGDIASPDSPLAADAIAHPHPLMGGDRHNPVIDTLSRTLIRARVAVVRLDFRGVGRSTGLHDRGVAERYDMLAALDAVVEAAPDTTLFALGYSFGGDVALSVDHPDLAGWVAVAPPLRALADPAPAGHDERPTTIISPAHDQFCAPEIARRATSAWTRTTVVSIPSADHFLAGRLGALAGLVLEAITPDGR
jgi:uncharacterized protein